MTAGDRAVTAGDRAVTARGPVRFRRYVLRTTNVASARALYSAALGRDDAVIVPLHEVAIARGARPHWAGMLGVDDVEATAQAFVARGATRLGPTAPTPGGGALTMLRDPGGAVVGLESPATVSGDPGVVWHTLNANDLERTSAAYRDLFGWGLAARRDYGALGVYQEVAWEPGGAVFGVLHDVATSAGRHPHWLFHLRVAALAPAIDAVRAAGGTVLEPITLPDGRIIAVCDDAEGAAFALTT